MNKPVTVCVTLLVMMLATVAAEAQDQYYFDGGGADDLWTTPANWELGQGGPDPTTFPGDFSGPNDVVIARTAIGKRVQVVDGMSLTLNIVTMWGGTDAQTMDGFDMTGGMIELVGASRELGIGSNTDNIPIEVNMSGGTFIGRTFKLASDATCSQCTDVDSDGTWNLSGTAVADFAQGGGVVGNENPRYLPSTGTLNMSGDAMLTVNNLSISDRGNGLVTIDDNARIILLGDHEQEMTSDKNSGYLISGPGVGPGMGVVVAYDEGLDQTVIEIGVVPSQDDLTWNTMSGNWNTPGNWDPFATPDDPNHMVTFADSIGSSSETVFTNSDVTVNNITFENTLGGTYAIMGQGSVNLESGSEPDLPATGISVSAGSHQFQTEVALQDDAFVDIAAGATLEFANDLILNGNSLTKTGDGTLVISNNLDTGGGTVIGLGGVITGSGTLGGDLVNTGGTLSPGASSASGNSQSIPEPSTLVLLAMGMLASASRRRRAALSESAGRER